MRSSPHAASLDGDVEVPPPGAGHPRKCAHVQEDLEAARPRRPAAAALAWSSPTLHADDWYVDAQMGSDTNDGQSAATAWRTLTHALAAIPSLPVVERTIHVAPGVYDAALGEVYPLRPRPLMRIVGTEGSALTILDGGGTYVLIYRGTSQDVFEATSGAEGLTLRNGLDGLTVLARASPTSPAFRDLRIESMSGAGIVVEILDAAFGGTIATPTGADLSIEGCGRGVELLAEIDAIDPAIARIELTRTLIRGSAAEGLYMRPSDDCEAHATLDRCRVVDNGADGVYGFAWGNITGARLDARASLFAGNGGCGAYGERHLGGESSYFDFEDCTIAGNALAGVRGVMHPASFRNCIVAGNADDIDVSAGLVAPGPARRTEISRDSSTASPPTRSSSTWRAATSACASGARASRAATRPRRERSTCSSTRGPSTATSTRLRPSTWAPSSTSRCTATGRRTSARRCASSCGARRAPPRASSSRSRRSSIRSRRPSASCGSTACKW